MQVLRELREALIAAKSERDGAKQELAEARKQVRDPLVAWQAFSAAHCPCFGAVACFALADGMARMDDVLA